MPSSRAWVSAAPWTVPADGSSFPPATLTAISTAARPAATRTTAASRNFFERSDKVSRRVRRCGLAGIGGCYPGRFGKNYGFPRRRLSRCSDDVHSRGARPRRHPSRRPHAPVAAACRRRQRTPARVLPWPVRREPLSPLSRLPVAHRGARRACARSGLARARGARRHLWRGEGRACRRPRELRSASRSRRGGDRVHRGRRAPGARGRHTAARAAGRACCGGRHRVVRRRRDELEPADAPRLRGSRLLHLTRHRAGRGGSASVDRADRELPRPRRRARSHRGRGVAEAVLLPAHGGGRRRVVEAWLDRRRALSQRPRGGLRRHRLSGQPQG